MEQPQIRRISNILKWTFRSAATLAPILMAGYWITGGYTFLGLDFEMIPKIPEMIPLSEMDAITRLLGFLLSLIPTGIHLIAFILLANLFASFEQMAFFTNSNVKRIKQIGSCALCSSLIHPVYLGLLSVTLTFQNPVGHRNLTIGFGSPQLYMLVIGLSTLVIASILEEGKKISDENACTV